MKNNNKKILILGGGFAGLYAYRSLVKNSKSCNLEITIINKTNYFLFTPLLHEVASGSLSHHNVVESIREMAYRNGANFVVADVLSVNTKDSTVSTNCGNFDYDFLIVATGSSTNFFETPGAQENSLVLKDLSDALKIRSLIIEKFDSASLIKDKELRKKELSFAIVGGGAIGVELVADIAELCFKDLYKYYKGAIHKDDITLCLVNKANTILPFMPEYLQKKAIHILKRQGVDMKLGVNVSKVDSDGICFEGNEQMRTSLTIWTGGVMPNVPKFDMDIQHDKSSRIMTNGNLLVKGTNNIFAIGDVASIEGDPLPMLAQVSVRQGTYLGKNMKKIINGRKVKSFKYKSSGTLISLGRYNAIAKIGRLEFSGIVAWFLWRTVYLFKFISNSKKIKIAVDWTINLFYSRDITKA